MTTIAVWLLSLVWRAFVYRTGVQWLSPPNNVKAERATMGAALQFAVFFTVVHFVCSLIGYLPGAGLLAWAAYAGIWLWVFASHFGLGIVRALGMGILQLIAMGIFHLVMRMTFGVSLFG